MRRNDVGRISVRLVAVLACGALLPGGQCSYRGHLIGGGSAPNSQLSIGPIGAFGSVFVDGVEFATGGATITVNGNGTVPAALLVGQQATVTATVASGASTGTATTVVVEDALVGPVSAVSPAAGTVTVLGQVVRIDGDTSVGPGIDPEDVNGLAIGDVIAVSGSRISTGFIASRLDRIGTDRTGLDRAFRVVGRVAQISGFGQIFMLGPTTVDFSRVSAGLPVGVGNGTYVAASGATLTNDTTLQATLVEIESESAVGARDVNGSLYGAVTRFAAATDFDVAGQPVTTTSSTTFTAGASTDLKLDAELKLTGQYDSAGTLAATSIDVRPAANVRVVGPIDALDASASTVRVDGITLSTVAATRWDDRSVTALRTFGFADLRSGDWVEVRGIAGSAPLAATANVVERHSQPTTVLEELQDVPSNLANPEFTLTGVTVNARAAFFFDATGLSLSRSAFFAQAAGRVVRARGTLAGGTLNADTVMLRN
jgi:hypothetical protein